MAVDIIVEDGTNVANANSYASVADLTAFADQRGINLPVGADPQARLLIKAMDYLVLYGDQWKGTITYDVQALPFPRQDIWVGFEELDDTSIPAGLKTAQLHLAALAAAGVDLSPTTEAGLPIILEKVGPLTTQYASPALLAGQNWTKPDFPVVDALLAPLLNRGFGLTTVRI